MNTIAMTFVWLVFLPIHLTTWVAKWPLAPIAVECCSTEDNKHLWVPFRWLETIDNDLGGDSGWKNEHIEPGSDPYSDWNRIKWLWRNGGNWTNYWILGVENDQSDIGPTQILGYTSRPDGAWLYRDYFELSETDRLEIFWGWNLWGEVEGRNKFVWTTRIKEVGTY
jgi:hypothetical protein